MALLKYGGLLEEFRDKIIELTRDLEAARAAYYQTDNENVALKREVERLMVTRDTQGHDLEAARAERDALQIEIGAANNDIAVFKDRYAELEGNYGYIVAKLDRQAHDLAEAKAEIERMRIPIRPFVECEAALQTLADSDLTVEQHSLVRQALSHLEKSHASYRLELNCTADDGQIIESLKRE